MTHPVKPLRSRINFTTYDELVTAAEDWLSEDDLRYIAAEVLEDDWAGEAIRREARVVEHLRRWHDEAHEGVFKFCGESPCIDVLRELES